MNKKLLLSMTFLSVLGLAGCQSNHKKINRTQLKSEKVSHQESKISKGNIFSNSSSNSKIKSSDNTLKRINDNQGSNCANQNQNNENQAGQQSNKSQQKDTIVIPNGNVAGSYLKQQLGYGNNSNIVAGNNPSYDGNDKDGHFYTVSLMDMSDRVQGKTGSMGIYGYIVMVKFLKLHNKKVNCYYN